MIGKTTWQRNLLWFVRASDQLRVSPESVTAELAKLNLEVHHAIKHKTVGTDCIVGERTPEELAAVDRLPKTPDERLK